MSEQLKEALSAAMDNETDAFELRRVLDEASGVEIIFRLPPLPPSSKTAAI